MPSLALQEQPSHAAPGMSRGEQQAPHGGPPSWHLALVAAVILVNVAVALVPRYFPYGDAPNHLARYTLINESWHGAAPPWVRFRWLPTGYIAIDVVGAALVALTSAARALRLLVVAYVVLLPVAAALLLRAVNPRAVAWSLVACLLTFNWYFLAGFLSYSIGVSLALLWLAWWWPRRHRQAPATLLTGAAGIALLYLVHLAAAATALAAVGVMCIEPLFKSPVRFDAARRRMLRRARIATVYFLPAVALQALMKWSSAFPAPASDGWVFRSTPDKLIHLLTPFASFSRVDGVSMGLAYLVALGLFVRARRSHAPLSAWPVTAVALLLLYLVCPAFLFGAWDVDVRFLLPACLIAFVGTRAEAPHPGTPVVITLALLAIAHAGETLWNARRIDARTDQFMAVLSRVPAHANTLVLVANEDDFFRVDPFRYVGQWLTIRDGSSRANGLFSGGPNGAYLGHFLVSRALYDPGVHWAREGFRPLLWDRVQADYTYIALAGRNNLAEARIREGAIPIVVAPAGDLFYVAPPQRNVRPVSLR